MLINDTEKISFFFFISLVKRKISLDTSQRMHVCSVTESKLKTKIMKMRMP